MVGIWKETVINTTITQVLWFLRAMDNSILFVNVINIESDSKVANGLDETLYVPE
jgi:hypothetical protein